MFCESAFRSFERCYASFNLVDALVEIAGGRPHDDHHGGRVAPILAVELFKPIQSSLDRGSKLPNLRSKRAKFRSKRTNAVLNSDQDLRNGVCRVFNHDKNITQTSGCNNRLIVANPHAFSTSTPGNGLPSIHSRNAPPAVET